MAERLEPPHDHRPDAREEQPASVMQPVVPSLWVTLGPWVLLACVVILGLIFWMRGGFPIRTHYPDATPSGAVGTSGADRKPGGTDPGQRPDSTKEELKLRGVDSPPQGANPPLTEKEKR
jgi:hypothetical protein